MVRIINSTKYIEEDLNKVKQNTLNNVETQPTQDVLIGNKIRNEVFDGNGYAQLRLIRQSIWALNVLRKEDSTAEEIDKAENILFQAEEIDKQIEEILKPQSL